MKPSNRVLTSNFIYFFILNNIINGYKIYIYLNNKLNNNCYL